MSDVVPHRYRRLALLGSAIAVLTALVVLASRPSAESSTSMQTNQAAANVISDVIAVLVMVVAVAAAGLLTFVFWPMRRRRRGKDEEEIERYVESVRVHWALKLASVVLPFLLIGGLIYAASTIRISTFPPATPVPVGHPTVPVVLPQATKSAPTGTTRLTPDNTWVAIAAAAILIATALTVGVWALRRGGSAPVSEKRESKEQATPALIQDLGMVLDESLEDLRRERDPRRAVITAYVRMERMLARHGLPRRDVETPEEYAARILRELGLGAGAIQGLTHVFELARFSEHEISLSMQEQAIAAVTAIRQEL
ncbi:MAG: hypothetical protein C4346_02290 [Chloroflexota bacterium]